MIHECYGPNVVANHIQEAGHETEWERMVFGKQSSQLTNINHGYSNCDSGGQVQVGCCVRLRITLNILLLPLKEIKL